MHNETYNLVKATKEYQVLDGTSYDKRTPKQLTAVLEWLRITHQRVELIYGEIKDGKVVFWEKDATPMRGTISRSMGSIQIPILVRTSRSLGGEGILDHCIVEIRRSRGGELLYQRKA